ncbi:MAG: relaxase/mobilization nuclease domain-containing protein [Clostridia bacterium]|nr:relaxase/mobilization nuclease domain-containing protein [Clostridia bacterium]
MAVTSLWRVKGYIGKVLLYAENPDKTKAPQMLSTTEEVDRNSLEDVIAYAGREKATNQRQLVSGINCTADNARWEMMAVKKQFGKEDGTIAYHGYQSFREGEVAPEQAHQIGIQLARELWGDRYQVLVATHLDKASHIHTHFVINTVSFVDGMKFHRTNDDYRQMQTASDRICREHGLSVVRHPDGTGRNYGEWLAEKEGKPTNAGLIRKDIDRAIAASVTERDFYDLMASWGYEFKFHSKNGQPLERPSLRPQGAERFRRFDRLGEDYTVDEICNRILENIAERVPFPEEEEHKYHRYRTENPPRTKAKGIAALYYHYCYELHILIRFPASVKKISAAIREDLRKLERLDEQTRFLAENKIETLDDLAQYQTRASAELQELTDNRDELRNQLRRMLRTGDEPAILEVRRQIAAHSEAIRRLRNTFKICDRVSTRAHQIETELEALRTQQPQGKENADELLRRSGGTGREDVPERR